ncbi:MAG TPA: thioredoxin domain-containing protein [Chloroflexota bacterium]|jgi:protein-disulfide isomerase|nr:thioredoxin domain-containing protein [Chloroflexota bacterium]
MATSTARRRPRGTSARPTPWSIGLAVAAAVVLAAGLIWLGQRTSEPAAATLADGPARGAPDAPVVIEEWADFQCPACRLFALGPTRQVLDQRIASGQVRLVFHNFAFLGPESETAAAAAACAGEQGRFWEYHDQLYREQAGENRGTFNRATLERFAAAIGLDGQAFAACLDDGQQLAAVREERRQGQAKGINSTPTLFINGQVVRGVPRPDQLAQLIDQAAARAGTEARP